tara:strand:+ start:550 stop:1371 length:822 start_codon:yes stop_codon:yes gene_type:complete
MVASWPMKKCQQLAQLYREGNTINECCSLMSAGQGTVQKYLRQLGVKRRPAAKRGWPQTKIDLCVSLYQKGCTQKEIAVQLKAGQSHVSKILNEQKVIMRHLWNKEKEKELIELYANNAVSIALCCRLLGTDKTTVRKYLKKNRIRIRPHSEVTTRGSKHHAWKGGRSVGEYIYVKAPKDHPRSTHHGYVLEHRLVMEQHLGRYLLPTEVVHHKDKNKHNNSLDNLELFSSNGEHLAHELKGQTPKWSEEGKIRIANAQRKRKQIQRKFGGLP